MGFALDKNEFVNTIYIRTRLFTAKYFVQHKEGVIMPETQTPQISTMMTRMDVNMLTNQYGSEVIAPDNDYIFGMCQSLENCLEPASSDEYSDIVTMVKDYYAAEYLRTLIRRIAGVRYKDAKSQKEFCDKCRKLYFITVNENDNDFLYDIPDCKDISFRHEFVNWNELNTKSPFLGLLVMMASYTASQSAMHMAMHWEESMAEIYKDNVTAVVNQIWAKRFRFEDVSDVNKTITCVGVYAVDEDGKRTTSAVPLHYIDEDNDDDDLFAGITADEITSVPIEIVAEGILDTIDRLSMQIGIEPLVNFYNIIEEAKGEEDLCDGDYDNCECCDECDDDESEFDEVDD